MPLRYWYEYVDGKVVRHIYDRVEWFEGCSVLMGSRSGKAVKNKSKKVKARIRVVKKPIKVVSNTPKRVKSEFREYIHSQSWEDFKTAYRASDKPKSCQICNSPKYQLHHLTYERKGRELLDDVTPLCWEHHIAVHSGRLCLA